MRGAWYRARSDLCRRWRATVLLVVVVGLAAGAVITFVAGARRASTAYDRFRSDTLAADLVIRRDGPPSELPAASVRAIERLPAVAAVTSVANPFIVPAGSGLHPYLDFLAVAGRDARFGTSVDRPRLLAGRMPDRRAIDEVALLSTFAGETGVHVGDRIRFDSYGPDQLEPLFTTGNAGPPRGPAVTLSVTGVFDAPSFLSESVGTFQPRVIVTSAFLDEHRDDMAVYSDAVRVRVREGGADVTDVRDEVREIVGDDPALEVAPASEIDAKIGSSIDVVVVALLLCALAAGVASAVAIEQALGRHLADGSSSQGTLGALGMTRHERTAAAFASVSPVVLGGAALAVVVAMLASPTMPVGLARRVEPDPGISIDGFALALGAVAVAVVVTALALVAAAQQGRRSPAGGTGGAAAPSPAIRAVRRTNLPPAAALGVGMAVAPTPRTAWSVRSALAAIALGATGVVAALVFAASLDDLVAVPARYGAPWDAVVPTFRGEAIDRVVDASTADPGADAVGVLSTTLARIGGEETNVHSLEPLKGAVPFTILSGHPPATAGEVALGAATMRDLGLGVGDVVELVGTGGARRARITGRAAFPVIDERSAVGRGALVTADDLGHLATEEQLNRSVVVRWGPDVDVEAANRALEARAGTDVSGPALPSDVNNVRDVRVLPQLLAGFLAALAVIAALHALASTVRARRHDLAILRTLGFQRRQLGTTLAWQATTIATLGLLLGVPLGLVAGRTIWRAVAGGVGVADQPSVPLAAVTAVVVLAVVLANLAAVLPARAARRVAPAAVLRAG